MSELKTKTKTMKSVLQCVTERSELTNYIVPEQLSDGRVFFKVITWNVAGLRGLEKKLPNALEDLCEQKGADMICIQEHKLQDKHVEEFKARILPDFHHYWTWSRTKKGYSGVAIFLRKSSILQPTLVTYGIPGNSVSLDEGRSITLEFPQFSITNTYVPNSGAKLERFEYRTDTWDTDFLKFHQELQSITGKPVVWCGDLNVAHKALDVYNEGAPHLKTQSGITAKERASFTRQLACGFVDAFRYIYPSASGHYSYWSQMSRARLPNKGLRLDYYVCSEDMVLPRDVESTKSAVLRDCYMIHEQMGSDHCPIVALFECVTSN